MQSTIFQIKNSIVSSVEEVLNYFKNYKDKGIRIKKIFEDKESIVVFLEGEELNGIFVVEKKRELKESLEFLKNKGKFPIASIEAIEKEQLDYENYYLKKILELSPDSAILFGKTGSGKTTAVTYFVLEEFRKRKIRYPLRLSLVEFAEGINLKQIEEVDLIFIDDLNTTFDAKMINDVIKVMYFCYDRNKRLFIATNENPKGLNFLPEPILSRLTEKCKVIHCSDVKDYRLRKKCKI